MLQKIEAIRPAYRVGAIMLILSLMLGSLIMGAERIHLTGTRIVLATAPVDPRSLLQGDYVVLGYAISTLDPALFPEEQRMKVTKDGPVYVELQPGAVWTPVRASSQPLKAAPGHVVLRGEREGARIRYGIEAFFVPEGQGYAIERMGWEEGGRERITVSVWVAPDGAALMDNLLIDGRPVFSSGGLRAAPSPASQR